MKYSFEQVKSGLLMFCNVDMLPNLPCETEVARAGISTFVNLYVRNIEAILKQYENNKFYKMMIMMGVIDTKGKTVNVDEFVEAATPFFEKGVVINDIPYVTQNPRIDTGDLKKIAEYIKEAGQSGNQKH